MAWWKTSKQADEPVAEPEPEPEPDYGWDDDNVDDEPGDDEPEPDAKAMSRMESELESRVKALRDRLAAHGLDLSDEGDPVIKDPKRFRDWARPAVSTPEPVAAKAPEPEPEPPAPKGSDKDIWEWTPEDFDKAVEQRVEQRLKPFVDQLQKQNGLIGRKYVDEAMQRAADALESIAPEYSHIIDHPQFEDMYRQQLSGIDPQYLNDKRVLASTAMGLMAWLDEDQMPAKKTMDEGKARAAVNRAMIPTQRTGIGQSSTADQVIPDDYIRGSRWLESKGVARVAPEELMALDSVDDFGVHSIDAYVKARKRLARAKGKSR